MNDIISGRTAVVTGAGNGLGRAIAVQLARERAQLALLGRQVDKLHAVAREVSDLGGSATVVVCDTSDEDSVVRARCELAEYDVSILVNNAGIAGPTAPVSEVTVAQWDEVFAVNVRGVYLMCREFLPAMIERRSGDIVNIASVAAKRPLTGRSPYGASKAAVLGLTASVAAEAAPFGVAVNSLSPGPIAGPRMSRNFALDAARRSVSIEQAEGEYVERAASKRMVTEEEVGRAVLAMLRMGGLIGADIDLSAGMFAR